jgi:hypothetical protein
VKDYYVAGAYVFALSKHNRFWSQCVPESRIYQGFQAKVVTAILKRQRAKMDAMIHGVKLDEPLHVLLILDDVISDKTFKYQEMLDFLGFNGRHYGIAVILCTQDAKGIMPDLRGNTDYLCATYTTQARTFDSYYNDFATFFPNVKEFTSYLQYHTKDYQTVIFNQSEPAFNFQDAVCSAKAELEVPPFQLGGPKFWAEAGCNWKVQLGLYRQKQKMDDTKLVKWARTGRRFRRQQREHYMEPREPDMPDVVQTADELIDVPMEDVDEHADQKQSIEEQLRKKIKLRKQRAGQH